MGGGERRAYEFDSAGCKLGTAFGGGSWGGKVGAVGPAADGEKDLEVAVAALEEVELLETAVEVGSGVVPAVSLPVDVSVGPGIGQIDLA